MDYSLVKFINSFAGQKEWIDITGVFISDFLIFALPLIIFAVYFFSKKRNKIGLIIVKIALGLILITGINIVIAQIIGRPRPFIGHREIYQLGKFLVGPEDFSFPSGHTTAAFVMAITVLLDWKRFGIILLILAILIGFGRIFIGVHYPSDVLAGIIVAICSVFLLEFALKRFKIFKNKLPLTNF